MKKKWQVLILRHDEASRQLEEHFGEEVERGMVSVVQVGRIGKYSRKDKIERAIKESLEGILSSDNTIPLFLYGSGDYHHYTYGLCRVVGDRKSKNYGYIHIDAHPDAFNNGDESCVNCGNFVKQIEKHTNASHLMFIGHNTDYNYLLRERTKPVRDSSLYYRRDMKAKIERLISDIPDEVYVTIDLDVLRDGIKTAYDDSRGSLDMDALLEVLRVIKENKQIIGVDILGYYEKKRNIYADMGYADADEKSMDIYRMIKNCLTGGGKK